MYREKGQPTYRSIVSDSKMQTLAGKAKQDNKTEELSFNPKFSFVFCQKKIDLCFHQLIFHVLEFVSSLIVSIVMVPLQPTRHFILFQVIKLVSVKACR